MVKSRKGNFRDFLCAEFPAYMDIYVEFWYNTLDSGNKRNAQNAGHSPVMCRYMTE